MFVKFATEHGFVHHVGFILKKVLFADILVTEQGAATGSIAR